MRGHRRIRTCFKGIEYWTDLDVCKLALVQRQVDGDFESLEDVAKMVGYSRSTVSRFLNGQRVSLTVTLCILSKLKLTFDEVFTRCEDGEIANGHRADATSDADSVVVRASRS